MTELQKNLQSARRKGQECFDGIMNAKDEANKILFTMKRIYGNDFEPHKIKNEELENKIKTLDEAAKAVKSALDLLYGLDLSEYIQEAFIK